MLVFEGATPDQVRRIGDIISRVVSSGGLARLATTADWRSETETLRIEPPGDEDIFESIEAEHVRIMISLSDLHAPLFLLPIVFVFVFVVKKERRRRQQFVLTGSYFCCRLVSSNPMPSTE